MSERILRVTDRKVQRNDDSQHPRAGIHAGNALRAIAYGNQHPCSWEWFATDAVARYPWPGQETKRWAALDAKGRARWFTSQFWNCGDVVPADDLAALGLAPGMSYARVVSRLRRDLEPEPDAPGARIDPAQSRTLMRSRGRGRG